MRRALHITQVVSTGATTTEIAAAKKRLKRLKARRSWYRRNRVKAKAYAKAYYSNPENRERNKARHRENQKKNPAAREATRRLWRQKVAAYRASWVKYNAIRWADPVKRARKRALEREGYETKYWKKKRNGKRNQMRHLLGDLEKNSSIRHRVYGKSSSGGS